MILRRDLQEASGGLIAAPLGPSPLTALVGWMPVIICLIWYEEEWSEPSWLMLIWTDGWTPPSSPAPPPSPVSPAPTPLRRRRPAGILLHMDGLQSANGWLSDRKVEDCQISDLLGENEGRNLNAPPPCLDPNSQKTPGNSRILDSLHTDVFPRMCVNHFFDQKDLKLEATVHAVQVFRRF